MNTSQYLKKVLLSLSLVVTSVNVVYGQITIGSTTTPIKGALLQLSNIDNSSTDINANKGLGLPRVKLSQKDQLFPMFELKDATEQGTGNPTSEYAADKNAIDLLHIGLLVYNISDNPRPECTDLPSGLFAWNGEEWEQIVLASSAESKSKEGYNSSTEILTDIQGNKYNTALFGTAGRWMTENLRTTYASICDLDIYKYDGVGSDSTAQYHWPGSNNKLENVAPATWEEKQGLLYNWYAATGGQNTASSTDQSQKGTNSDTPGTNEVESVITGGHIQGLCPKGWHLPSDREWNQLEEILCNNPTAYSSATDVTAWDDSWAQGSVRGTHGKVMKTSVTLNSYDPNGFSFASSGTKKGFYAMLLGNTENASNSGFGRYGYFWSSSASSATGSGKNAIGRQLEAATSAVTRASSPQEYLYSVRCKMD